MRYLIAIGVVFFTLLAFILVERLYRRFAKCNPQLGPFRSRDGGCGGCAAAETCSKHADKK